MGHMKAVRQGRRLTTKIEKDKQQNDNDNGNDNINNFKLELLCPHLELAKGHQVACELLN